MKSNKEGWIRHRGGKCPVEAGTLVDVRYRDGDVFTGCKVGESFLCKNWSHTNDDGDIMAYRLHTPSEQPATVKESLPVDPIAWRDRITEIDAESKAEAERHGQVMTALDRERAELVQKLASEGLALIERKAEPVEDMSDWRNWSVGDIAKVVSTENFCDGDLRVGQEVKITHIDPGDGTIKGNAAVGCWGRPGLNYEFVLRPTN